jgi:prepilin-type N-terminal cleavage/methylation domain-containing protein
MRTYRRNQGFTLIELMIVVVIVGILALVAIPRFTGVTVQAKQAEAEPILKQLCQLAEADRLRTGAWPSPLPTAWRDPNAKYFTAFALADSLATATADAAHPGVTNRTLDCVSGTFQ